MYQHLQIVTHNTTEKISKWKVIYGIEIKPSKGIYCTLWIKQNRRFMCICNHGNFGYMQVYSDF